MFEGSNPNRGGETAAAGGYRDGSMLQQRQFPQKEDPQMRHDRISGSTSGGEISGQLTLLAQVVGALESLSSDLSNRLQPVRRQVTNGLSQKEPIVPADEALCGLADVIRGLRRRLEVAHETLSICARELEI